MGSQHHLSPLTGVSRMTYQKRHSLNMIDDVLLRDLEKTKKRPSSLLGLPRLRSRSQNDSKRVSSLVFRIAFLGSKGVGKSSIVKRYLTDGFTENYRPTVSEIYEKSIMRAGEEAMIMFKIYDTAGDLQFEFPAMFGLTVVEVDMFVLVYSVANRRSFETIEHSWKEILDRKGKQVGEVPIVLVGNKSDVSATRREVSEAEGHKLANDILCPFFEISAKTGHEVNLIYDALLKENEQIEHRNGQVQIVEHPLEGLPKINLDKIGEKEEGENGKNRFLEPTNRPVLKPRKGTSCIIM